VRPNQQISITIYDSGAAEGDQEPARRFLGQVKLKPSEIHNRMIDSWFRLQGREVDEQEITGEVRVTIKYQAIEVTMLSDNENKIGDGTRKGKCWGATRVLPCLFFFLCRGTMRDLVFRVACVS